MEYFHQILLAYTVLHCLDTGIQNKDNASPSISVTGHGKLVGEHCSHVMINRTLEQGRQIIHNVLMILYC